MKTLFGKPKHKYLSDIISISSPASARLSVKKLQEEFSGAVTRTKRLRIARATQLAANRSGSMLKRSGLSAKERTEFKEIYRIYSAEAARMFKDYGRSQ